MKLGVFNMILNQKDKVRNGSQKIHHKPKNQGKFHPKFKQCLLHSSMLEKKAFSQLSSKQLHLKIASNICQTITPATQNEETIQIQHNNATIAVSKPTAPDMGLGAASGQNAQRDHRILPLPHYHFVVVSDLHV
ncbi:hypothetical protein TNCV_2953921 [Trichonephila clavipes]|nr:hypothetical protein TNCV_2953921 [Trichonephila clavipes]